ncbi:hypothetical protein BLOT_016246 [Blomia tropicalis]|nr:hypothetical protein BLOT_016246 [Blomia tropicalis]
MTNQQHHATERVRLTMLEHFYSQVCANDDECRQLERIFFQAFDRSPMNMGNKDQDIMVDQLLMDQFEKIYLLIYSLSKRLGGFAIHCTWTRCCHIVAHFWSERLAMLKDDHHNLLRYLLRCWQRFRGGINMIHSLTVYAQINILHVRSSLEQHLINDLCHAIFSINFLTDSSDQLVFNALVEIIEQSKHDSTESIQLVRNVLNLLTYLDIRHHTLYYQVFGFPFLERIQILHQPNKSVENLSNSHEMAAYLRDSEEIIDRSIDHFNQFHFTEPLMRMIGKLLYTQLIGIRRNEICSFDIFKEIVCNTETKCEPLNSSNTSLDRLEHLTYLYRMVSYDPESINLLASNVERLLTTHLQSIELDQNVALTQCDEQIANHFFGQIWHLYQFWFYSIGMKVFQNDTVIHHSMEQAFSHHINSNPIYGCLLALVIHFQLVNETNNNISTTTSTDITKLLMMIEDKKAVGEYIRFYLCDRILRELSPQPERDIVKVGQLMDSLQIESQFSVKLLIKDYNHGVEQLEDRKSVKVRQQEFHIRLLNCSFWNLDSEKSTQTYRLPKSFWTMYHTFRRRFIDSNTKKFIQLNRNYGSAIMDANIGQTKYQFVLTLKQVIILLIFNHHHSIRFEQLINLTKLDRKSLLQCLRTFYRYNLLTIEIEKKNNTIIDDDQVLMENELMINDRFDCNKIDGQHNDLINWIQLQHGKPQFSLKQVMIRCGSIEPPIVTTTVQETKQDEIISNGTTCTTNEVTSIENSEKKTNTNQTLKSNKYIENNLRNGTARIEAAVVRVMKRATIVTELKTLHQMTIDMLCRTSWPHSFTPRRTAKMISESFTIVDLKKVVDSLEKNGYLHIMPNGEIVYEP